VNPTGPTSEKSMVTARDEPYDWLGMPAGLTSPMHLFIIISVALIVLGPEKLPHALRQVGRTMGEVRRWSDSISGELRSVLSFDGEADAPVAASPRPDVVPAAKLNGAVHSTGASPAPTPVPVPTTTIEEPSDDSIHPALQVGGEWR